YPLAGPEVLQKGVMHDMRKKLPRLAEIQRHFNGGGGRALDGGGDPEIRQADHEKEQYRVNDHHGAFPAHAAHFKIEDKGIQDISGGGGEDKRQDHVLKQNQKIEEPPEQCQREYDANIHPTTSLTVIGLSGCMQRGGG